jgi:hypothetical protein
MVIVVEKYGQLGNRLFSFSHLIANSLEHNYKLYNPSFEDYANYFEYTRGDVFINYKKNKKSKNKKYHIHKILRRFIFYILFKFVNILKKINYNSSFLHEIIDDKTVDFSFKNIDFQKKAHKKIIFICNQFYFRDYPAFWKYQKNIKGFLTPSKNKYDFCIDKISKFKNISSTIIGVHFRGGDFRTWMEGRYFIDFSRYLEIITAVSKNFNEKPLFIIFSNEKVDINLENVKFAEGDLIEDIFCLSMCDYIIGGYSSYAYWASFYGNVPFLCLNIEANKERRDYQLKDFILMTDPAFGNFP